MNFLRFMLPFLFVRNWHDGSWELSRARLILICVFIFILFAGLGLVYLLQMPVTYKQPI